MTSFYSDWNISNDDTCYEPLDYLGNEDFFSKTSIGGAPAPVQLAPKHCDWNGKHKLCEQKYFYQYLL